MRKRPKTKHNGKPAAPVIEKKGAPRAAILLLGAAIAVSGGVAWWWSTRPDAQPAAPAPQGRATTQPAAGAETQPDFRKLKGQWRRPDGGYVLEISAVADGGKLDAAYFNPRPIHVAKAEASLEGAALKVFVELRDVRYPGSTYNLVYDPQADQLLGIYYQAALQQRFEVLFVRIK